MQGQERRRLGLLCGLGAYACWGLLSPVGKHLLGTLDPLWLNTVRFALAAAILLPVLGGAGARGSFKVLANGGLLWANLLANTSLTCFLYALTRLEATQATLLFYSAPLWTAWWAHVRLGERVGWAFAPAAAGLLAGGYVALFGVAAAGPFDVVGLALGLASAVLWAFFTVALRRVAPTIPTRPLVGSSFVAGAAYFLVLALVFEPVPAFNAVPAAAWGWLALYVAVPTLGSFALFAAAIKFAPAGLVNVLVAAELAFTAVFAALLLGDRFSWDQLAGLTLALFAVSAYLAARAFQGDRATPAQPAPAGPGNPP